MMYRLLSLFFLFIACQKQVKDSVIEKNCRDYYPTRCKPLLLFENPAAKIQYVGDLRIDAFTGFLAAQERVESENVGFSGRFSEVYQVFDQLREQASLEQLILLLQHQSPNVRYYALLGLSSRDTFNKGYYYLLLGGKYDTLVSMSGCVVDSGELWVFARYQVFENKN